MADTFRQVNKTTPKEERNRMAALLELEKLLDIPDKDFSWQEQAKCKGMTDTFFCPRGGSPTFVHNRAKAICATCPVKDRCLEWALTNGVQHGVWGGMTAPERMAHLGLKSWHEFEYDTDGE